MAHRKYQPSTGPEAAAFAARWCNNCKRQQEEGYCEIAARSLHYPANAPEHPGLWHQSPQGPTCSAFLPGGEIPVQRCSETLELFADVPAD